MRKILVVLMLCVPMLSMAQNVWEKPQAEKEQIKEEPKKDKKVKIGDPKYLAGAVPETDGKVVFTLDIDAPGKSAQTIYDITYGVLDNITKESNQFPESEIALVNKHDYIIAARYKEWLVFSSNFISLDRTEFNYTIIAKCTDGHLHLTLERISYVYEEGKPTEVRTVAENIISDKTALNKDKTKLQKFTSKFRTKTIDRKDNIFSTITYALK